jgi:hypothetical protein
LNARIGYTITKFEVWANAINVLNNYYAVLASKSTYGYSYQMGNPRELTIGLSYKLGKR